VLYFYKQYKLYLSYNQSNSSNYYTLNSLSLFWLAESVRWIFEISARDIITADYTIIMSRTLKVTGNHVMYDRYRGAWFLRVIMSSSRALCCSPSVKKQKHDLVFFVQCKIKQLVDSVFVRLRLITLTSTSIILDITKTSSNNCLQFVCILYQLTYYLSSYNTLTVFIIHSKYFSVSNWLKPHASFTINSCCWPRILSYWTNDVKSAARCRLLNHWPQRLLNHWPRKPGH